LSSAPASRAQGTCPACGTRSQPAALYDVGRYTILRCPSCGLGQTLLDGDFDPTTIYTGEYFQGGQADGYQDYQGSRDSLSAEFAKVLRDLQATGATHGRLLEIGCAYGYFLDEARRSFEVSGVELAEDAVAACIARGLDVVREADETFYRQRGPFDAVVMLDVIEHLTSPGDLLDELARHTRPGGHLLITTGDFNSLIARAMGRHWRLMTPPQHVWFFTPQALTGLLDAHGFRLLEVTHPTKRVPLGLIAYQLARYVGAQQRLDGHTIAGSIPVNLFDAMRVVATRV